MPRLRLIGSTVLLACAISACHDDRPVTPSVEPAAALPTGTAQATIRQVSGELDGTATFVVRVMSRDLTMSSFQGAITFTPGTLELIGAATPAGATGGRVFVINTEKFADGRMLFAGLTPSAFADAGDGDGFEAFRFTVRSVGAFTASNLVATLDVVGKDTGIPVAADRLLASPGVRDVAGQLIR